MDMTSIYTYYIVLFIPPPLFRLMIYFISDLRENTNVGNDERLKTKERQQVRRMDYLMFCLNVMESAK
jgi:hypothetical protein